MNSIVDLLSPISERSVCGDEDVPSVYKVLGSPFASNIADSYSLKRDCEDVLLRDCKHIGVAVKLAIVNLQIGGLRGFGEGLDLVDGLLCTFWDAAFPLMQDGDARIGSFDLFNPGERTTVHALDFLKQTKCIGEMTLESVGEVKSLYGERPPEVAGCLTFIQKMGYKEREAVILGIMQSKMALERIELRFNVKRTQAPDLSRMRKLIDDASEGCFRLFGAALFDETVENKGSEIAKKTIQSLAGKALERNEILQQLEGVRKYFDACEPSSPVATLIERAQAIAKLNFVDIARLLHRGVTDPIAKLVWDSDFEVKKE